MSNDDPTDDAQLVQAALAGDRDAFGELVERYQDRLFNTLVRMLGSRDDANDVVQEAFVQAFVKLETFRGDARFYTWLYRIAMNMALSHRRRQRPTVSVEAVKDCVGDEPVDHDPGPDVQMIGTERVAAVQSALAKLGDQHRQILVLREMEGCSYETIAEILQMPIGTVRSRLFRARLLLKDELKSILPDEVDQTK
ncbi:MAG: RNA polymerase sigma factor [Aeoliella sp.]